MNISGNEKIMINSNNYVTQTQIDANSWNVIKSPAIFFAKVGAAVLLDRKRLVLNDFLLDNNTMSYSINENYWDCNFCYYSFQKTRLPDLVQVGALPSYNANQIENVDISIPNITEQRKIGSAFASLDSLITLHQRNINNTSADSSALVYFLFSVSIRKRLNE